MIAIGGAIGTGLFLGAGGLLAGAGPALALVFAICGVFAFFILRSLGELVLHRPSSGSFVSYAREFYGEKFAYVAGWMYFLNWAITWIVDLTAVALYLHYWSFFTSAPQWLLALIKVVALVAFLAIGIVFLAIQFSLTVGGETVHPCWSILVDHGGAFPTGLIPVVLVVQGVVFAYEGIELVGTASGETQNVGRVLPRAINTVILRIAIFYVGSMVLLSLHSGSSPGGARSCSARCD